MFACSFDIVFDCARVEYGVIARFGLYSVTCLVVWCGLC